MCDYSLMGIPNRLAREGEDLVVHTFSTGSRGLTPDIPITFGSVVRRLFGTAEAESVAVCVPPGAELLLGDIPEDVQRSSSVGLVEKVKFVQLTATPNEYRDAVRFSNGCEILLQGLYNGQRVRVLQLSLMDEPVESVMDEPVESVMDELVESVIDELVESVIDEPVQSVWRAAERFNDRAPCVG